MSIPVETLLLIGSLLLFLSLIVGKAGTKFGVPTLLLFLGIGCLAGSDGLYFIPRGNTRLNEDDVILVITDDESAMRETMQKIAE